MRWCGDGGDDGGDVVDVEKMRSDAKNPYHAKIREDAEEKKKGRIKPTRTETHTRTDCRKKPSIHEINEICVKTKKREEFHSKPYSTAARQASFVRTPLPCLRRLWREAKEASHAEHECTLRTEG